MNISWETAEFVKNYQKHEVFGAGSNEPWAECQGSRWEGKLKYKTEKEIFGAQDQSERKQKKAESGEERERERFLSDIWPYSLYTFFTFNQIYQTCKVLVWMTLVAWEIERTELRKPKEGWEPWSAGGRRLVWKLEPREKEELTSFSLQRVTIWLMPFEGFCLHCFTQSLYAPMVDSILSLILEERKLRSQIGGSCLHS